MNSPTEATGAPRSQRGDARVLLTGAATMDAFTLIQRTLPPHPPGEPLHAHPEHSEGCYVLEGTVAVSWNDRTVTLVAGTAARIPAGARHTFWNPTALPAAVLLIYTPGTTAEAARALADGPPAQPPAYDDTS